MPPRPPTFKREVRSSPVQRSKRCPISECLKKIEHCMRGLLGYVEDCANAQMSNSAERSHNLNSIATSNNNGVSLENSDDGCTETMTVEQRKEALIVDSEDPDEKDKWLQAECVKAVPCCADALHLVIVSKANFGSKSEESLILFSWNFQLLSFISDNPSIGLIVVVVGGEDEHLPSLPSTSYLKLLSQGHSSLQPEDIAIICCTSGTTRTPKCLKKIEDCMRELLGYVEDCANAQMSINAGRSHNDNIMRPTTIMSTHGELPVC
ncbi:long chain acyl-CoA synthetase 6, peroxisomal [Melia azedarach]|uniref:Long chain acyl-CoA synthetase 6, peroxisomal n=1 Tax=Melia azedarach TaxID=155640 RepID=A0ACC1YH88_MELAZ|nr:long chain acyl-CoA synthetase 6, peroxisomal [Melia azedarach]